ncbi:MAG: hypothetical protein HOO96_27475 [Polyangiaceae bacterium]|nr:hypothetical protein [Polyangiaceae bacterium]
MSSTFSLTRLRSSAGSIAVAVLLLVIAVRPVRAADSADEHDQFRREVFACEGAVAHLADCCPSFEPKRIACSYDYEFNAGCESPDTSQWQYPAITEPQAQCILSSSCEQIRSTGMCARAQLLQPPRGSSSRDRHSSPDSGDYMQGTDAGTVCP